VLHLRSHVAHRKRDAERRQVERPRRSKEVDAVVAPPKELRAQGVIAPT